MATPYYLRFANEAEATSVLYTTTVTPAVLDEEGNIITEEVISATPNFANIDTIGVIYRATPEPVEGEDPPVPVPYDGWFVNVLVVNTEDGTPLDSFKVDPQPYPMRVWAT